MKRVLYLVISDFRDGNSFLCVSDDYTDQLTFYCTSAPENFSGGMEVIIGNRTSRESNRQLKFNEDISKHYRTIIKALRARDANLMQECDNFTTTWTLEVANPDLETGYIPQDDSNPTSGISRKAGFIDSPWCDRLYLENGRLQCRKISLDRKREQWIESYMSQVRADAEDEREELKHLENVKQSDDPSHVQEHDLILQLVNEWAELEMLLIEESKILEHLLWREHEAMTNNLLELRSTGPFAEYKEDQACVRKRLDKERGRDSRARLARQRDRMLLRLENERERMLRTVNDGNEGVYGKAWDDVLEMIDHEGR
ncbi:hypothetical protein BD410DRAFT_182116 [Rickenella mellea]|uniref:Uncharacterized protein n=1 Tax=Rickenella mellea TaxID=50990 RepID=A0A4Y7PGL4_9AGAM|nr:hypothetical protein BD410DRAFT_182116 [Rickenella mellea]